MVYRQPLKATDMQEVAQPGQAHRALHRTAAIVLTIVACSALLTAQAAVQMPAAGYASLLDNARLHAYRLELPPSAPMPVYAANHDQVWVALSPARLSLQRSDGHVEQAELAPGAARFFPAEQVKTVTNQTGTGVELVVVELKQSPDAAQACHCTGVVARTVCGCRGTVRLPSLWAVSLGSVVLSGTTLNPGQSCCTPVPRGDTLVVAITPLDLGYEVLGASTPESASSHTRLALRPGDVAWLRAGTRELVNSGNAPAQFVSIELD